MFPASLFFAIAGLVALAAAPAASRPFQSSFQYPLQSPLQSSFRAPLTSRSVIVQMFEWTWDSIAAECTAYLGPAGYGFVQTSPPQETIQGSQWWTDYQPVSYNLTGKRGDRSQFENMISTCHDAGVGVIVDTVMNHMTQASASGNGTGGSPYTKYDYPGIYNSSDFHYCGLQPDNQISNYSNAQEVWTCELDHLADLATDTDHVRGRLAAYINDLISLGADGLRLDASKHMNPNDLANILSRISSEVYITQEVIFGEGEGVQPSMYTHNGDVQEFRYTTAVMNAFNGQGNGIAGLQDLDSQGWVNGSGANVFVANHDTERGGSSLAWNSPSNEYYNAMIFSLAHPYGMPTILSSYKYSNFDDGAPNNGTGTCSGSTGTNGWLCQHRWVGVAGMTGFRNNVTGAITNWVSPASNRIAFGRGSTGFVAINNADSSWTATFTTSLPAGTYCDVVSGPVVSSACSAGSFIVSSSGTFTATVPARLSIGIYAGSKVPDGGGSPTTTATTTLPTASNVQVTFAPKVTTVYGESVLVVGSLSQLGKWSPGSAVALSPDSYPVWNVAVSLPAGSFFEYKYIKNESGGSIVWESDPNRQATTPASRTQTLNDIWR